MSIELIPEHWRGKAEYEWEVVELLRSVAIAAWDRLHIMREWADGAGVVVTPGHGVALGVLTGKEGE